MIKKICLILFSVIILALTALNSTMSADTANGIYGKHTCKINFKGDIREYLVYIPSSIDHSKPAPVVLNFHGGGANAKMNARFTAMNSTADKHGFIVVYPEGTPSIIFKNMRTWYSGEGCCGRAYRTNSDDVGFVDAIIKDINSKFNIDNKRIYSTGMSNGAMMSYKLACNLSDKIAAIAPVGGTDNVKTCTPERPVPVIHFHGTGDKFCSYNGGVGSKSLSKHSFNSVPNTINRWKKINGCSGKAVFSFKNKNATCETYNNCKDNSEVTLCTIKDMGHTWPGGNKKHSKFLGKYSDDISANEEMWKFFQKHPLK